MTPQDQIQQALEDLAKINDALHIVNEATTHVNSKEDFDAAMQKGFAALEEIEERRGGIDL